MIVDSDDGHYDLSSTSTQISPEFVNKINCLIVLMAVIFTLLCVLLVVCLVM